MSPLRPQSSLCVRVCVLDINYSGRLHRALHRKRNGDRERSSERAFSRIGENAPRRFRGRFTADSAFEIVGLKFQGCTCTEKLKGLHEFSCLLEQDKVSNPMLC